MTAAGRPRRDGLSIGAVLAQLRGEFPDVTISKIRFLESEGLVRPGRSASGYRQFTDADVQRLRFVLSAQRDHYLPLKVIREQLDAADHGSEPAEAAPRAPRALVGLDAPGPGDAAGGAGGLPSPADFMPASSTRLTREELLAEGDIDAAMLGEIERFGLIRSGAAGFYDSDAVEVAKTVKAMTEFGIEPRHLRAFRASADREVGLLEQIITPVQRHRDEGATARADEIARELAALSVTLHTLLVKAGIHGVTGK